MIASNQSGIQRWSCAKIIAGLIACLIIHPAMLLSQRVPWQSFSVGDGLPSNSIKTLLQDSKGYLWIGTSNGLSRYDGTHITTYHLLQEMSHDYITALAENSKIPGNIWIGTVSGGIYGLDHDSISSIDPGENNLDENVSDLLPDPSGRLWCATYGGLKVIDNNGIHRIRRIGFGPSNVLLARTRDGTIYAGFHDTLFTIDPDRLTLTPVITRRPFGIVSICGDSTNTLWVVWTDSTLVRYVNGAAAEKHRIPYEQGISMVATPDGSLWISLYSAVCRVDPSGAMQVYGVESGIPETVYGPVLVDREGNLWVGSWVAGLYKLSHFTFRSFTTGKGQQPGRILSGIKGHGRQWWLGAIGGVTEIFTAEDRGTEISSHFIPIPPTGAPVFPTAMIGSDKLVVAAFEGREVRYYNVRTSPSKPSALTFSSIFQPPFPDTGRIGGVKKSTRGDLFVSVLEKSLLIYGPGDRRPRQIFRSSPEFPTSAILYIIEDHRGDIWCGDFKSGLVQFRRGRDRWEIVKIFTTRDGLPDMHIRSLAEDGRGRIWIGTRYKGVTCYDGSVFHNISLRDGLSGNAVGAIAADNEHTVWVGTETGLERIDGDSFRVIPSQPFLRGAKVLAAGITADSSVWYCTPYAFNLYDYRREGKNILAPPVYIRSITVNGTPRQLSASLELPSDIADCTIEFVGISFRDDGVKNYNYRLEGADTVWRATAQHAITFAGLSPGDYTFMVKAINTDGVASTDPATVFFHVPPPYWRRWWFIVAANVIVLGVIGMFALARLARLRRERELQREFSRQLIRSQEEERKRIAHELHDGLGQDLLVIKNRVQMALTTPPDPATARHFDEIMTVTSDAVNQVRAISANLRPYQIDNIGLTKALQSICDRMAGSTPVEFITHFEDIDGLFKPEFEINAFRIVQEGINNIIKHSEATLATVSVRRDSGNVVIAIEDNGKGIGDHSSVKGHAGDPGFGLQGIAERVRILGGKLDIASSSSTGTHLIITIPEEKSHG